MVSVKFVVVVGDSQVSLLLSVLARPLLATSFGVPPAFFVSFPFRRCGVGGPGDVSGDDGPAMAAALNPPPRVVVFMLCGNRLWRAYLVSVRARNPESRPDRGTGPRDTTGRS